MVGIQGVEPSMTLNFKGHGVGSRCHVTNFTKRRLEGLIKVGYKKFDNESAHLSV